MVSTLRSTRPAVFGWGTVTVLVMVGTIASLWASARGLVHAETWTEVVATLTAMALVALGGAWLVLGAWRRVKRARRR